MKKLGHFITRNFSLDFAIAAIILVAFMMLGYYAREFALDLQVNFLGGWGAF